MRKLRNITILVMVLLIGAGTLFAGGGSQTGTGSGEPVTAYTLPRNETLYFNGLQWGTPAGNNPYGNVNNTWATGSSHRQLQYETLFTYNLLDGKLYPQIGDSFSWSGQALTVVLNKNVKFKDGTPLTAADVVYTFELGKKYSIGMSGLWNYLDSVSAKDDYTVVLQGKAPPLFNRQQLEAAISETLITSKAYWESKIANGELGRGASDLGNFVGWDCYGTGPYTQFYADNLKNILVRNDNYWGKIPARYGKLPLPKYIAHNNYQGNATGDDAFRKGEVDVSQQFIDQVWKMWEVEKLPISTYLPQAPYYLPGQIPAIIFNTTKPGLNDKNVRKAIARVIDYDMIGTNAMSGYTAKKQASMMLPSASEQALIDLNALKPNQWDGIDVAGANKLLDDAGWVRGADGVRAKGGVRLAFRVQCPAGWSDWNASLEIVAQAGRQIGMALTTYFTEQAVWNTDMYNCTFDIIMNNIGSQGISATWARAYSSLSSKILPPVGTINMAGNFGRYSNARIDQLIDLLANETNAATLKTLWTELNQIYLDEMPWVGLMYRPWWFHTVNESVWTGYPKLNDGTNVPPTILIEGYGIKGLYNLKLAKK
jgi:peptide/nickel transport system substrate-binding protein